MKKKTVKKVGKPSIGSVIWINDRFDKLEKDHIRIVNLLKGGNVSEKLSTEIRLATAKGKTIDRKVPDLKTEE